MPQAPIRRRACLGVGARTHPDVGGRSWQRLVVDRHRGVAGRTDESRSGQDRQPERRVVVRRAVEEGRHDNGGVGDAGRDRHVAGQCDEVHARLGRAAGLGVRHRHRLVGGRSRPRDHEGAGCEPLLVGVGGFADGDLAGDEARAGVRPYDACRVRSGKAGIVGDVGRQPRDRERNGARRLGRRQVVRVGPRCGVGAAIVGPPVDDDGGGGGSRRDQAAVERRRRGRDVGRGSGGHLGRVEARAVVVAEKRHRVVVHGERVVDALVAVGASDVVPESLGRGPLVSRHGAGAAAAVPKTHLDVMPALRQRHRTRFRRLIPCVIVDVDRPVDFQVRGVVDVFREIVGSAGGVHLAPVDPGGVVGPGRQALCRRRMRAGIDARRRRPVDQVPGPSDRPALEPRLPRRVKRRSGREDQDSADDGAQAPDVFPVHFLTPSVVALCVCRGLPSPGNLSTGWSTACPRAR